MLSQSLRHRVDVQALVTTQDEETGAMSEDWESILESGEDLLAASIAPITGREFLAAQSTQASVSTRITIRHRPDLKPSMRVVHQGDFYNIRAILPDPTLRGHIVLMCESGLNAG